MCPSLWLKCGEAMHTEILSDPYCVAALAPEWRQLLERSAVSSIFMTPTWLQAWWRQFGAPDRRQLRFMTFYLEGRLVGLAPFSLRTVRYGGAVPIRRLELLATGEPEASEICSEYLGVIAAPEHAEGVAVELVNQIRAGHLGAWDDLFMRAMSGDDPFVAQLESTLRSEGYRVEVKATGCARSAPLPGSWGEYLQSLGSRHRYGVKRALRDFEAWAGEGNWRLVRADTAGQLGAGQTILRRLHGERWRQRRPGGGVFADPRFAAFHQEVMERTFRGEDGRLDLLWLTVGGKAIAAIYNLVHGRRVYFYQSGRSLDVPEGVRPGLVIHALAIRRAIGEGLIEYDFLGGESQYKRQLAPASRQLLSLHAVASGTRPRALAIVQDGGEYLLARARSLRARVATVAAVPPRRPSSPSRDSRTASD